MENIYTKWMTWYLSKPWWMKALLFVVPLLLVVLYAVKLFGLPFKTTERVKPADPIDPPFGQANETIDKQLEELKKELLSKLETVRQVGVRATERREAIKGASTMAELDALKVKYGL